MWNCHDLLCFSEREEKLRKGEADCDFRSQQHWKKQTRTGASEASQRKIISADSFEVYRGLDDGSAKPSATDRKVYETYELISTDFRCEDILSGANGVLSEARWLLDLCLLPNTSSDTPAIGYRQAMEYLLNVVDKWV